jgi:hypothetical protein
VSGDFQLAKLQFPAAYTSFMQITLATTSVLSDLRTSGSLTGGLAVRENGITSLHLAPQALELHDNKDRLHLSQVTGDVTWAPAGAANAPTSKLSWSKGGAYGLSGGAATIEFLAQGAGFRITKPTKLPVFDGALAIDTLSLGNLDGDNMEVAFKGNVEPISMPLLAKAFGWPEFSGTLAASVPGVTLKDNVLTFQGNVESRYSAVTSWAATYACRIRWDDSRNSSPTSRARSRSRPAHADVRGRQHHRETRGRRARARVVRVVTDGVQRTPRDTEGDKSRHRISAKAVSSLSNVGGGGGGVVQALQSGRAAILRRVQLRQARHHVQAGRRRLRDVRHRARGRRVLHRQGSGPAANRHHRQPGTRQLEPAALLDFDDGIWQRNYAVSHSGRVDSRAFGPIIARTFDVRHVQGAFIGRARSCPRPGLRLE